MTIQIERIPYEDMEELKTKAFFHTPTSRISTFGDRVKEKTEGKRAVAAALATRLIPECFSAFVSDGSSSHFVGVALALNAIRASLRFCLHTNSMSIAADLQARPLQPGSLTMQQMGGSVDFELFATFHRDADYTRKFIQQSHVVILSVRELFFSEGPTTPDEASSMLKEQSLLADRETFLITDWTKLSAIAPARGTTVYANKQRWEEVRDSLSLTIVCDRPPDMMTPPAEYGQLLASKQFNPDCLDWSNPTRALDRYCWQAYQFQLKRNIRFVEVVPAEQNRR